MNPEFQAFLEGLLITLKIIAGVTAFMIIALSMAGCSEILLAQRAHEVEAFTKQLAIRGHETGAVKNNPPRQSNSSPI
jgi:hypothetical protein